MSAHLLVVGHPPRRASSAAMRVSDLLHSLGTATARRRRKVRGRFRGPYDWRRLFALGILLVDLAVLALANTILGTDLIDYRPGMAAIFGGLLLSIIMIRLGRPELYFDWIATGLLHVALGLTLISDPLLTTDGSFTLFSVLLLVTNLLTIWIGATLAIIAGRPWLIASGLTSLLCLAWMVFGPETTRLVEPDFVSAVELLLLGFSILGLAGAARREVG